MCLSDAMANDTRSGLKVKDDQNMAEGIQVRKRRMLAYSYRALLQKNKKVKAKVASQKASVSPADATPLSPTRCCGIFGDRKQSDSTEKEILSSCLPTLKEKMDGGLYDASIAEYGVTEYRDMLSVVEAHGGLHGIDDSMVDADHNMGSLKERFSKDVACGGKLDSSRFVEYWIPVQISDVQLEQYCATLLSNSLSLCSQPSKRDPVGAFRNILISTRKCCDHPYLVDKSLQSLLVKDLTSTECLDVGIKACGKLQLLDRMLSELKNQGARVLILFQPVGGGRESISMGDILDDFLQYRFGSDSYERVHVNVLNSKKKSAMNNFNNGSERFVFLLETRACRPTIKLSSVHAVIIFHSDWDPLNDLRALQRITLDSQLERIKVFRLYSSFTVEEKVLILAKRNNHPDGHIQNMRPSNSHMLLMWGASYLFKRLDQFHRGNILASSSSNFSEQSLLEDVAQEFLTILTQNEDNDTSKLNIILKVEQNQGTYSTTSPLFGESRVEGIDDECPLLFWAKLFNGKSPRWKYSSDSSLRSRKRVQYFDDSEKVETVKKQRKRTDNCVNQSSQPGLEEGKIVSGDKNEVLERETILAGGVKSRSLAELSNKPSSNDLRHVVICLPADEQRNSHNNQENVVLNSIHISEGQKPEELVSISPVSWERGVEISVLQETIPVEVVECGNLFETVAGRLGLDTEGEELDTIASKETSIGGLKELREAGNPGNNEETDVSFNPCSRLDGDMLSMPSGHIRLEVSETIGSSDCAEDCLPLLLSSDGQIHDGARSIPEGQVPREVDKMFISNDGLEDVVTVTAPSSEDQIPYGVTTSMPDIEVSLSVPESVSFGNWIENFVDSPCEEQIDNGSLSAVPDENVLLRVSENVDPSDDLENAFSLNPSYMEQIPDGAATFIPSADVLGVPVSSPGEIAESGNINGDKAESCATTSDNVHHNLHMLEQSHVNSPSARTETNTLEPSSQALQDVCSEPATSTEVQYGDAAASEIQVALQVEPLLDPVDAEASNVSNHGTAATEPVVSGGDQPNNENDFANEFAQSPTIMVENRAELSNQGLSDPAITSSLNPPTDRLEANSMDTRIGIGISGNINRTVQNAAPSASQLPHHMIPDPLQIELESLRRSADEAIKIHEETKLKMKSDCDREIEEAITQIRWKYELKLQDLDSEFILRKQVLDANKNKVLMNKLVAEAFRLKSMEMTASSAEMHQEVSASSILQQLEHIISQCTEPRPPIFASPSDPPTTSLPTAATPGASLPITSQAASQYTAVPTSLAVPRSSALLSSIPSRPSNFSPRVSATVNHQLGQGIRAPPHLRSFRPPVSLMSTSSSSSILPSPPSNPRRTSLPLPHHPVPPPLAAYISGLHHRPPRPEASGVVPSLPNPHRQSATGSPIDFIDNRNWQNQIRPSRSPLLSDDFEVVELPNPNLPCRMVHGQTPAAQMSEPHEIIYLLDDD